MTSNQIASDAHASAFTGPTTGAFDSHKWLRYFQENRQNRPTLRLPATIELSSDLQEPLTRSLQRFQIGETGDGQHLRKFASRYGDRAYLDCVDMFVREEQNHAQILSQVIGAMNGTLLTWHWTDIAFVALRRLLGLKTELLILLIAEIIGKNFYKCVAERAENSALQEIFSLIVLDEIVHLEFHTEFLSHQLQTYPWLLKYFVYYSWCLVFYTACFAFVLDHKRALSAMKIESGEFISTCSRQFHNSSRRALGMERPAATADKR